MRFIRIAKLSSLLAAAVAAIAASSATAGAAAPRNACGFLARAEIVKAIGEPVKTAEGGKSATGAVFCNWTGDDDHLLSKGIALIAAVDAVDQRWKGYASLLPKAKKLPGVGTQAVTDGTVVLARSGKALVQIGPLYADSGITLATVKALAVKALARAGAAA